MEVAIASFKFKLLNIILDQLMDCNVIIDHYRHIGLDSCALRSKTSSLI